MPARENQDRLPVAAILTCHEAPRSGRVIGQSRAGRDILGHRLGTGPAHLSLIGGCHADEPVGPKTLRRLASHLEHLPPTSSLLEAYTWSIVPHVNPDGEQANRLWISRTVPLLDSRGRPDIGYHLDSFLEHAVREAPGDDIEFGFPRHAADNGARPENRAVAAFLASGAPSVVHGSLHGMAFAPGPWFLLEESWVDRTDLLRRDLRDHVANLGYRLFDPDRRGEKGFARIDEGFSTRPDSLAMRRHFEARGKDDVAARFRPSSMEFVRGLGGDPLTFVSEMPLFLMPLDPPSGPAAMAELSAHRQALADRLRERGSAARAAEQLGVLAMPVRDQMRLQLLLLDSALETIRISRGHSERAP